MALTLKALNAVIADFNYWGESEGDSPLKLSRTKSLVDEKRILSYDASMRLAAHQGDTTYKVPASRTVQTKTLQEVFTPLVTNALAEVSSRAETIADEGIESLEMSAEALEFYTQLYSAFNQSTNPKVCYVHAGNDPEVGLMIVGENTGETIVAKTLLIQT